MELQLPPEQRANAYDVLGKALIDYTVYRPVMRLVCAEVPPPSSRSGRWWKLSSGLGAAQTEMVMMAMPRRAMLMWSC